MAMRYVRQAGNDPAFLLKALREVAGELQNNLYGFSRRDLLRPGEGYLDEGWSLQAIAFHLLQVERGVARQVELIIHAREPDLRHVDFDDIPFPEDVAAEVCEEIVDEFHYLRRHNTYQLWDLDEREWQRGGMHPYRGRITLVDIARDLYQHDLEHLWQMKRMLETFTRAST